MKVGDLVKLHLPNDDSWGIFLGYRSSNGYVYSEVLWFHGTISGCQSHLLTVIGDETW